jgi:hypothetical protein
MESLQIGPWIAKYDGQAARRRCEHIEIGNPSRCSGSLGIRSAGARIAAAQYDIRNTMYDR